MENANNKTEKGLLQASIYVPGQVNAMSMTRGFTPTQWVIGRSPNQVQSVTGDLFTPTVDELVSLPMCLKRLAAQTAFTRADSDAKLRRAMNQQIKDTVVVGQVVYKQKWRGLARVVAIEQDNKDRDAVIWLAPWNLPAEARYESGAAPR